MANEQGSTSTAKKRAAGSLPVSAVDFAGESGWPHPGSLKNPSRSDQESVLAGSPCIRPRGAEQQAVQDQNHEPTARGSAPSGDLFWSRLLRAPQDQGEYWGRLFGLPFWRSKKVTGPARPKSALAARQNILMLQSRSWFDKLTTNGGHGARWWRDKTRWLVSICGGLKPTLRGLRTLRRRRDHGPRHPLHHPP